MPDVAEGVGLDQFGFERLAYVLRRTLQIERDRRRAAGKQVEGLDSVLNAGEDRPGARSGAPTDEPELGLVDVRERAEYVDRAPHLDHGLDLVACRRLHPIDSLRNWARATSRGRVVHVERDRDRTTLRDA